jgi:hypothetical protein
LLSLSTGSGERSFSLGSIAQRFSTQPDPAPDFARHEVVRVSPESAPRKTADMTQQQKISAALLRAGIASPAAWAAAGVSPAVVTTPGSVAVLAHAQTADHNNGSNEVAHSAAQEIGFEQHPPVVLMKGAHSKPFLISWRSQQQVARSLGWKCTLMIWGGAALALLSLYFGLGIKNLF